jgi:hypothetical protein
MAIENKLHASVAVGGDIELKYGEDSAVIRQNFPGIEVGRMDSPEGVLVMDSADFKKPWVQKVLTDSGVEIDFVD